MSYEPTNWKAGDTVTSAKLNKLEQGVASNGSGGILIVHIDNNALDKTWKEIKEAMQEKIVCIYQSDLMETSHAFVSGVFIDGLDYVVTTVMVGFSGSVASGSFATDSEDGYPATMTMGPLK